MRNSYAGKKRPIETIEQLVDKLVEKATELGAAEENGCPPHFAEVRRLQWARTALLRRIRKELGIKANADKPPKWSTDSEPRTW